MAVTLFVTDTPPPPTTPTTAGDSALQTSKPQMRDMGTGTGTEEEPFDPDSALSEEKLEKILKESGLAMSLGAGTGTGSGTGTGKAAGRERRKKDKSKEVVHQVDRI